jgi:hypothetical protein
MEPLETVDAPNGVLEPLPSPEPADLYFIDTYLRQQGDYASILAIDAALLRTDVPAEHQQRELQSIIQGVFRGKQT